MQSAGYSCQTLRKLESFRQVFEKRSDTKFYFKKIPSSGSRVVPCGWTDRHDDATSPITDPRCPEGSRKLRFPDYVTMAQDGGKVVSLTRRPLFLPPGNVPCTHFCWRLSRTQDHSAIGMIRSVKNSNDTIWNRTSDLPICSKAP